MRRDFNYVHSWGSDWQANWGSVGRDREKHEGILILDQQRPGFTSDTPRMSRNLWGKRETYNCCWEPVGQQGCESVVKSMCSHQWGLLVSSGCWGLQLPHTPHNTRKTSTGAPKGGGLQEDPIGYFCHQSHSFPAYLSLTLLHVPFNPPVCAPLTLA